MTNPYSAPEAPLHDSPSGQETYQPSMFAWRGRIGRVRYLAYSIGLGLITTFPLALLQGAVADSAALVIVLQVLLIAASIVVTVVLGRRRLNDMGYSGWQVIGLIIPIVNFFVGLWLLFARGDEGRNEYGPAPGPNTTGVIVLALALPVIVVIGIVAAIAGGAYSGYKQKADSVSSQSI